MDNPDYTDLLPSLVGAGITGLLIFLAVVIVGFMISAFITALWLRLVITFMRKPLDREYGRMRMAGMGFPPGKARPAPEPSGPPLRTQDGPRDWSTQ